MPPLKIEGDHLSRGMNTGIGPACAQNGDGFAAIDSGEGGLQFTLNRLAPVRRLALEPDEVCSVVFDNCFVTCQRLVLWSSSPAV